MAKVNWKLNDVVTPDDMNLIGEEINQANIGVDELRENGSTTDNMIGDRTIIDTAAPTANTGKLTTLLGSLAYMIKSITGKSSWRTAPATTLEAAKTHMDDTTKHITAAERTSWNAKETTTGAQTKVDAHANLTNNPHAVTKAQVGLSNVGNYGLATQAEAEAGASDAKYMTPLRTKEAIQKLVPTPTKADVGLGNVDNVKQATKTEFDAHAIDAVKHITAAERTGWNSKASTTVATSAANGLMSAADKSKLDGVAVNANNYTHPTSHPPSIITQDASNRFVTDAEKAAWNAKASTSVATTSASGLMSNADKSKLDGIAAGANNYTHPATHPPSIIAQDASNRFMTDAERTKLGGIATGAQVNRALATQAQAIAGTDNTTDMTPLRVREAIDSRTLYGTTAGTATALTLTLSPAPAALYTGLQVTVKLHIATGTNPTLNINGLGAKALYDEDGARFSGGESGKIYVFIYDGTNFILRSGGGGGKLNVYNGVAARSAPYEGVHIRTTNPISNVVTDNNVYFKGSWLTDAQSGYQAITQAGNNSSLTCAIRYENEIYFLKAGITDNEYNFQSYSLLSNAVVTRQKPISIVASGSAMGLYGEEIHVIGGLNAGNQAINYVQIFNIRAQTWSRGIDLAQGIANSAWFQDGEYIYMFGSNYGTGYYRFAYRYHMRTRTINQLADFPTNVSKTSGGVVGQYAYIISGRAGSSSLNNAIQRYDIQSNTYSAILSRQQSENLMAAVVGNEILYGGGRMGSSGSTVLKTMFSYNTVTNVETPLPDLNETTASGVFVLLHDGIFLLPVGIGVLNIPKKYTLIDKVYVNNTLVILRSDNNYGGGYFTELHSNPKITGANNRMATSFSNVYYYLNGFLDVPKFYGDGSSWVQINQ